MFELKEIVKLAIAKNELHLLMLGIGEYDFKNTNHNPLHVHEIMPIIYELYGQVPGMEYIFEKAMINLINKKNAESFYIALKYQLTIYDYESKYRATFKSPTHSFASALHQSYSVNKQHFEKITSLNRLGIRCNSDKGVSKEGNLKTKIDKLNNFAQSIYDKPLF